MTKYRVPVTSYNVQIDMLEAYHALERVDHHKLLTLKGEIDPSEGKPLNPVMVNAFKQAKKG